MCRGYMSNVYRAFENPVGASQRRVHEPRALSSAVQEDLGYSAKLDCISWPPLRAARQHPLQCAENYNALNLR